MDGWSGPLAVRDLFTFYAGGTPPTARPFRDHLSWLAAQDPTASEAAWGKALAGVEEATLVAPDVYGAALPAVAEAYVDGRLTERARELGVTLNTVVQGASLFHLARGLHRRGLFTSRDLMAAAYKQARFRLVGVEDPGHVASTRATIHLSLNGNCACG